MVGKRLVNTGEAAAFDPIQNFETVVYTGNGGTQKITGYIRKGAAFNGSSSKIILPNSTSIAPQNNFTFSAWFNTSTLGVTQTIYAFNSPSTYQSAVFIHSNGTNNIRLFSAGSNYYSSDNIYQANQWYHLVVTKSSTSGIVAYLDGVEIINDPTATANNTQPPAGENRIGGYKTAAESSWFNGKIDQVRIFNEALNSTQAGQLALEDYTDPKKSTTDYFGDGSGVALYELDEDANDSSGYVGGYNVASGSSNYIEFGSSKSAGKYYWEVKPTYSSLGSASTIMIGIQDTTTSGGTWTSAGGYYYYSSNGEKYNNAGGVSYGATYTVNDIIGVALDLDNNTIQWYKNGTLQGANAFTGLTGTYRAALGTGLYIEQAQVYFDTNDWTYSAPSGYSEWTDNLTATHIYSSGSYAISYNGTPANVNFLGMMFQPDLVWIKNRDRTHSHQVFDSIRGVTKQLITNVTSQELTDANSLTSFDANGFTLGSNIGINGNNESHVAWCWKAGGVPTPNNNTNGTITSTVSANQDAGFSIVKYTSTTTSSDTVGHGLSQAPELYITKRLGTNASWWTYTTVIDGSLDYLALDRTMSKTNSSQALPTSSVFTTDYSEIDNIITYCFHSVDGYQKVGSYSGNGSASGPTITTGFRPRFLLVKGSSIGGNWNIHDSIRDTGDDNIDKFLIANTGNAEGDTSAARFIFNDNGFQVGTSDVSRNSNGETYIYLAIA